MAGPAEHAGAGLSAVRPLSWQVSRYALASGAALAIDWLTYLLTAGIGLAPALAGVVGYATGMLAHYLLSILWVFDARASGKGQARLALEFVASGLLGLALTAATIALATSSLGLALVPAKLLAIAASFASVFLLRRMVVFAVQA